MAMGFKRVIAAQHLGRKALAGKTRLAKAHRMDAKPHVTALIIAAGSGERAGAGVPKQYREIEGKAVLAHAIDSLAGHSAIDAVRVVIGDGQQRLYDEAIGERRLPAPVSGSTTRQGSVLSGLEAIAESGPTDIVLIHDAARPFVPGAVIDRLITACVTDIGAIPVLPVTDSLAGIDGQTVRREDFVTVQTPQAFAFETILQAHRAWNRDKPATDDAEIVRASGHRIATVEGDKALKKLTFAGDFDDHQGPHVTVRTGMGLDVHAFAPGDHLWLGGIRIDHDRSLAGHSDADVALHALTDAILGALAEGDIGDHFPPGDPQWKGAGSEVFLGHARDLAKSHGLALAHVDVTIICEAPRIGPHREAMRARVAEILAMPEKSVSIKATTTERLGFTGRGEGIAAQAVATLVPARR